MLAIIFFIGLIAIVYWFIANKINVDFSSFFRQTLPLDRGKFGVYCFTGKQGSGKTYSLVKFIKNQLKSGKKIYSNITMFDVEYERIESVEHLLSLKDEKNALIVYDEIFTLLAKNSKISKDLMEFLTQQRKMKNIFLTTAQEWLEIPITFRRFVRIQIDCKTYPLGKLGGILKESYFNAYEMKWSQLDNEYIAPLITNKISKYEKRYMLSYDTFERIRQLPPDRDSVATERPNH